jgi:hypothetical protein
MNARAHIVALLFWVACAMSIAQAATDPLGPSPDRLILITVADDVQVLQGRPGSTPRGYDGLQRYSGGGAARAAMKALANDYHLTQVDAWPIPLLKVHCAVFEIPKESTREEVLTALKSERRVRLAQPLETFETRSQTYNDPYVGLQSGFRQLDVADAHGFSRGDGVKVAIIDTGIDLSHPDLRRKVVAHRNFVDTDSARFSRDRHGTQVAGVVAALANNNLGIVGVAPGVRLVALKACWQLSDDADAARCNSFTLAKAISAAIETKSQIVNLSLGGPADPLLAQLVGEGIRRGIVFIGAASGDGPGFPQDVPGVLAVTASESGGSGTRRLHAPGREILTLLPEGRYDFASGSSLAVAHVTGTVALLLARDPRMRSEKIFELLDRTSMPVLADRAGWRSINACAALASTGSLTCSALDVARTAGQATGHSAPRHPSR